MLGRACAVAWASSEAEEDDEQLSDPSEVMSTRAAGLRMGSNSDIYQCDVGDSDSCRAGVEARAHGKRLARQHGVVKRAMAGPVHTKLRQVP